MNGKFIINVKTILAFWAQLDTPDGMFYISIGHILCFHLERSQQTTFRKEVPLKKKKKELESEWKDFLSETAQSHSFTTSGASW